MSQSEPEFPVNFVMEHCPKVLQEREYRKRYTGERDDEADLAAAECAFHSAGFGVTCENCQLHVSSYRLADGKVMYPQDEHFQDIKDFYEKSKLFEKAQEAEQKTRDLIMGAGI